MKKTSQQGIDFKERGRYEGCAKMPSTTRHTQSPHFFIASATAAIRAFALRLSSLTEVRVQALAT